MTKQDLDYQTLYRTLGSVMEAGKFAKAFRRLGSEAPRQHSSPADYAIIRNMYQFWQRRGFLTKKQINYAYNLLANMCEL